ncbi:MAG: hypothetical protein ACE5G0_14160 [Rhodothermales bacterium]
MDDIFIYLVIGAIYLIFQVLGAQKKKKKGALKKTPRPLPSSAPSPPARTATAPQPTLDDALREIRQALGMETPSRPPVKKKPAPVQKKQAPTTKLPKKAGPYTPRTHAPELIDAAAKPTRAGEFKAQPKHYADADFEALATEGDRFGKRRKSPSSRRISTSPRSTRPGPPSPDPEKILHSSLLLRLQDPSAAQEAFILSEILGLPRALQRR